MSARRRAFKNPSFERIGSPFRGRIARLRRPTVRRLIGGYGGLFCGIRAVATRRYTWGQPSPSATLLGFKAWNVGLVAFVLAMAVGGIHPGASWGSSAYDPTSDPYSMQNITAGDGVQAWWNAGYTGQGVDVAVIDTGVAPVPALDGAGKIINGPDLSLESQDPCLQYLDTNGHGTFMAGIIAGNDGQPGGYRGVAPDARIVSLKVGAADGGVDVSQVIAAIDWVVQHRNDNGMNIRVINLSYGTNSTQPYTVDPLAYAVEQAWKAGHRGRRGGREHRLPSATGWARRSGVRPVRDRGRRAPTRWGRRRISDDRSASFSAALALQARRAASRTSLAPGTHLQGLRVPGSYIDQTNPSAALGDRYFRGSGTSEATAITSGAVALLLQKYPKLTPDQVKEYLRELRRRADGPRRARPGRRRAQPGRRC